MHLGSIVLCTPRNSFSSMLVRMFCKASVPKPESFSLECVVALISGKTEMGVSPHSTHRLLLLMLLCSQLEVEEMVAGICR